MLRWVKIGVSLSTQGRKPGRQLPVEQHFAAIGVPAHLNDSARIVLVCLDACSESLAREVIRVHRCVFEFVAIEAVNRLVGILEQAQEFVADGLFHERRQQALV